MTAYASSQNGNWSSTSTWGNAGPPTDGDTVKISHAVTVNTAVTIGTSAGTDVAGTGTVGAASYTVTGSDTAFTTQLKIGDLLTIGGTFRGKIYSIESDVSLTMENTLTVSSGASFTFTPAAILLDGSSAHLIVDAPLTVRGALVVNAPAQSAAEADVVTVNAGAGIEFDASTAPSPSTTYYPWLLLSVSLQASRIVFAGEVGNRCYLRSNSGGGNAYLTLGNWGYGGYLNFSYTDCTRIGDATHEGFPFYLPAATSELVISNCVFDFCGLLAGVSQPHAEATLSLINSTWKNSQDATNSVELSGNAVTVVKGCVFDKVVYGILAGATIGGTGANDWNHFQVGLDCSVTDQWSVFRGNLVRSASNLGQGVAGTVQDCYWLADYTDNNPHHLICNPNFDHDILGLVFEYTGSSYTGDCINISSETYEIRDCIKLPNGIGLSSGTMLSCSSTSTTRLTIEHNTFHGGGSTDSSGVRIGETQIAVTGLITSFRGNLYWDTEVRGFKICVEPAGAETDAVAAADADYNGGYNFATGSNGLGYDGLTFSTGSPGAHDVTGDPQFVWQIEELNPAAGGLGIKGWDASLGGPGTVLNALAELSKKNDPAGYDSRYSVPALLAWVRALHRPTNVVFAGATYPGDAATTDAAGNALSGTVGAMAYLAPTPSGFTRSQEPVLVADGTLSSSARDVVYGSAVTAGNLLVLAVNVDGPAPANVAVADNLENTWSQAGSYQNVTEAGGWITRTALWYAVAGSSGSCTVTLTPSAICYLTAAVHEYAGNDLVVPLRATGAASTSPSDTSISSGTVTAGAGDLVFAAFGSGSGGVISTVEVTAPFTLQAQETQGNLYEILITADVLDASGGDETAIWTISPGVRAAAVITAFHGLPTTDYALYAPATAQGLPGIASGEFTVILTPGVDPGGTVTITPVVSGATGTCTPTTVDLSNSTRSGTFTVTLDPDTPADTIATISVTDSSDLSDPAPVAYQAVYPDLAGLAGWEANMAYGLNYPAGPLVGMAYYDHYDAPRVFQGIQDYYQDHPSLGDDSVWSAKVATAVQHYRDQYVLPYGGAIASYFVFNQGLATHYTRTGDDVSRTAAILLRRFDPTGPDDRDLGTYWSYTASRDLGFYLSAHLTAEELGYAPSTRTHELATVAIDMLSQYTIPAPRPYYLIVQPFMGGILCEALIAYWDRYRNHPSCPVGIPAAIKSWLDWAWDNVWDNAAGAFLYVDVDTAQNQATQNGTVQASPSPTTTAFAGDSGLEAIDHYYMGGLYGTYLTFTSGVLVGQGDFYISDYVGSTRLIQILGTLPQAPTAGDTFTITYRPATAGAIVSRTSNTVFTGGSGLSSTDDYYKYGEIMFTSGERSGYSQTIQAYDGPSKTFTITESAPPPGTNLAEGDTFLVRDWVGYAGSNVPAAADNPHIGSAYAWYYQYTVRQGVRDNLYRLRHDAVFNGYEGVTGNFDNDKAFNVCYKWPFQGLKWRDYGDSPWPAATALTLTALDTPSGRANAWSGRFRVALDDSGGAVAVDDPVTITLTDDSLGGTFTPAAPILTTDKPYAIFRYRPPAGSDGEIPTVAFTNDGALDNPAGVAYTVAGSAPDALGYFLSGPAYGPVGSASTAFTLALAPTGAVPAADLDATGGLVGITMGVSPSGPEFRFYAEPQIRPVFLSSGVPSLNFSVTPATEGTWIISTTNDSSLASFNNRPYGGHDSVISVLDYGATGDGATDDTAAIQAALDAVPEAGAVVYVPAGVYRLSASLVIGRDGTILVGDGPTSILRLIDGVKKNGICMPVRYEDPIDSSMITNNSTISRLVVDGNLNPIPTAEEPSYFGVWVRQAQNVVLSELIVRDWAGDGITISNGELANDSITVEKCLITGNGRNGLHVGFASNIVIRNNHFTNNPNQYWQSAAANAIDVEVEGHNQAQYNPYTGDTGTFEYPYIFNLMIYDNIFERDTTPTSGDAIALQPAYGPLAHVTIANNEIHMFQVGVETTGGPISYDGGAHRATWDITIIGNRFNTVGQTTAGFCVLLNGTEDSQITDNFMYNVVADPSDIYLVNVQNSTIARNTIISTSRSANWFSVCDMIALVDNRRLCPDIWWYQIRDEPVTNLTDTGTVVLTSGDDDSTSPSVALGITDGTVLSSSSTTPITVTATDTGSGVARVYFFIDGVPQGFSDTAPYVFTFDPSQCSLGSHELEVLAVDRLGNLSSWDTSDVVVGFARLIISTISGSLILTVNQG